MAKTVIFQKRVPAHAQKYIDSNVFKISLGELSKRDATIAIAYMRLETEKLIQETIEKRTRIEKPKLRKILITLRDRALVSLNHRTSEALHESVLSEVKTETITIEDAATMFIEMKERTGSVGASSMKAYEAYRKWLILLFGKHRDIDTLTLSDFEDAQTTMKKLPPRTLQRYPDASIPELLKKEDATGLNSKTINGVTGFAYNIIHEAMRKHPDYMQKNPAANVKKIAKQKAEKEPFDAEDIRKILEKTDGEVRNICLVGMYTGMRISEIAKLKAEDVKHGYIEVRDGKTENATRNIPIHPAISSIITEAAANGDHLFHGGNAAAATKKMNREINKIIPDVRKTFHSFRKNFTTQLYALFPDREHLIKYILGHSNAKNITFNVYNRDSVQSKHIMEMIRAVSYAEAGTTAAAFSAA